MSHHSNIRISIHQVSQVSHLLVEIVLPDLPYPALLVSASVFQYIMAMLLSMLLLLLESAGMCEPNPSGMACQASVASHAKTPSAVQASGEPQEIPIGRERINLGIRIDIGSVAA